MLILKIAGVVAIVILLLLVAGLAFVIRWFRKIVKQATDQPGCPPCRVHPQPEPNPKWRDEVKMLQCASEFTALGFEKIGAFTVPEMPGMQMLAFVHPTERLYAAIYDYPAIGHAFDINCIFEDGAGLSASSKGTGKNLDERPFHPILWVGDDCVATVLNAFKQHPQPAPRVPVTADQFVAQFERDHAAGMNWRMKKGGVSREEIRRHIVAKGEPVDEETVEAIYKNRREAHILELQKACLAQYLDDEQLLAAEWERIQDRTFAIAETLEPEEIIEAIESVVTLDEEQRHVLNQLRRGNAETALDLIDEIILQNTAGLCLQKTGEVQEPVRAYILLAPSREAATKQLAA
ncbi:MAG: hypothetical protein JWO95_2286 [Verrucomicrobiales bacterium]|nr:hypothetical protein [Verrucomicrobiales bacterium]